MTTLTIPDVDETIARGLRTRAAAHGRSIEAEARAILADAVTQPTTAALPGNMADAIRKIMVPIGSVDLPAFLDEHAPEPPRLD